MVPWPEWEGKLPLQDPKYLNQYLICCSISKSKCYQHVTRAQCRDFTGKGVTVGRGKMSQGWPIPIIMITSGTRWVRQKMESNHVPYCWLGEQEKFGELMAVWCQASLAIALCIQLPEYGDKLNLWKIMVFTSLVIKTAYLYFFHFYSALYLKKKKMYKRNSIQMYQMPWGVCILSRLAFLERKWCWIAVVLVRV